MAALSASMIDTRIVYGFPGAGKTSYICDCIRNDYFYRYGRTLILCFERGEEGYDETALLERNAYVAYYDEHQEIAGFCMDQIRNWNPDRIYVEMNTSLPSLRRNLPEEMHVTSTVTWIDWKTMDRYFADARPMISQMITESQQVTFRGCPSKELLAPYSQEFRLMNHKASYLREDPMGYHEKAFDLFVPYSLEEEKITIRARDYLVFWLDAADHPEHYKEKQLSFPDPLEIRKIADENVWSAGRVVMTCCMADLQFMAFDLTGEEKAEISGGWFTMEAVGRIAKDDFGRKKLKLELQCIKGASAPKRDLILQGSRRMTGPDPNLSVTMFQRMNAAL